MNIEQSCAEPRMSELSKFSGIITKGEDIIRQDAERQSKEFDNFKLLLKRLENNLEKMNGLVRSIAQECNTIMPFEKGMQDYLLNNGEDPALNDESVISIFILYLFHF